MIEKTQEEIMSSWKNKEDPPLISIKCITYNHEPYIHQALDGFLSQVTDFPFEIVVHDDASTDQTAEIVRTYEQKYPLLIKAIYETENQYSKHDGTIRRLMQEKMQGKYIAVCEGDDYWIDACKLQKQVDFLEKNPEYVMCFTNFNFYYQRKNKYEKNMLTEKAQQFPHVYTLEKWVETPGYVGPMTWVVRTEVMNSYQYIKTSDGSFAQFAHFLASGKVHCLLQDTTAVYRSLTESASHSVNPRQQYARQKSLCETKLLLADRYDLSDTVKSRIFSDYYNCFYKLISMSNDKEEIAKAKKYCVQPKQKIFLTISSFAPVRKVMCLAYQWKHR